MKIKEARQEKEVDHQRFEEAKTRTGMGLPVPTRANPKAMGNTYWTWGHERDAAARGCAGAIALQKLGPEFEDE